MNKGTYDSMSPAQKQVIDQHCTPEWAEKITAGWVDFDVEGRSLLAKKPGHTVYKPTAAELRNDSSVYQRHIRVSLIDSTLANMVLASSVTPM